MCFTFAELSSFVVLVALLIFKKIQIFRERIQFCCLSEERERDFAMQYKRGFLTELTWLTREGPSV